MNSGAYFPSRSFSPRLILLQIAGNLAFLALAYGWLAIPDGRVWHLAVTAFTGIALAAGLIVFHIGFLQHLVTPGTEGLAAAWKSALGRVAPVFLWLVLAHLCVWAYNLAGHRIEAAAIPVASWLTYMTATPIAPETVEGWLGLAVKSLGWLLALAVLIPWGVAVGLRGWKGMMPAGAWKAVRTGLDWRYLGIAALLVATGWAGSWALLFGWIPKPGGLIGEALSFSARGALAILLASAAWLGLLEVTGRLLEERPATLPPAGLL